MPTGIMVNVSAVFIGGILGQLLKKHFPKCWIENLPLIFGLCATTMGIYYIKNLENLSPLVLAMIVGTMIGESLKLEANAASFVDKATSLSPSAKMSDEQIEMFTAIIVLFCASGTGIFGSMNAGFSGDHSVLFAKSILDFFTAAIFGITLGAAVSFIAIPQGIVQLILFFSASALMPFITDVMSNDFKACGGVITMAVGFKMLNIQKFKIVNMLPALILIMPFSSLWTSLMG